MRFSLCHETEGGEVNTFATGTIVSQMGASLG
jgi:hypothetical protein